ncbi:L-threonate dehydrogenase [Rhizobium terrae]|uniref:L-threonate dehydrogenase n=1 Tax=Rhizobium terrae TaxID=2171756 RepID=UPI000E3BB5FB|nr:L-threonate dehydrogenase [Rhizobium terrae]
MQIRCPKCRASGFVQSHIGVIGLGSMGFGMAISALRAGHRIWGQDINHTAMERLQQEGGTAGISIEAAAALDAVVIVVLNAAQMENVLFGPEAIVPRLRRGAVVLGCVTVAPAFAQAMETRCAEHDVLYLDAPISGGSLKAANGCLTIMASGKDAAFAAARPVLDALAETVFELGASAGSASAMKATNQLLAGVHIAVMAEALTFAATQGIDAATFLSVIQKCAGTSWMLENRAPHIVSGDYTPHSAIDIWPKDLGIVREIAGSAGFEVQITTAALRQFADASAMGLGREDDAAVVKVYARQAGVVLPGVEGERM